MAETANKPVAKHGDHDRVQMLSLKADGTPDQLDPEIIGDKDTAVAAAKEQFKQQAVSAADVATHTGRVTLVGQKDGSVKEIPLTDSVQDPSIEKAQKQHEEVAKAAESAAEKTVSSLHQEG